MFEDFIKMIFPEYCLGCSGALLKGEHQICTRCLIQLPITDFHTNQENDLIKKFAGKYLLKYALAYLKFTKNSSVQKFLHALKYNDNQEIGVMLGKWYGALLKTHQLEKDFDLILPVPLHLSKLKKRGYNQSDCFAEGLSVSLGVEWSSQVLIRRKATETQTRKGRFDRWLNVNEIFDVADKNLVENKNILLVDDVITTGATIESCLNILNSCHPKSMSIASIAIARN